MSHRCRLEEKKGQGGRGEAPKRNPRTAAGLFQQPREAEEPHGRGAAVAPLADQ